MTTALEQQLAVIAANSTHQLDLKAQKARHSQSILFEPRDAAKQSFDTIYQICHEGFEELCMLDSRFVPFGRNLFDEQSKDEDRTQLTRKESSDLDKILENFLSLVGGKILLNPALKAIEWLVRRFRVHENNAEFLLFTFLPYHSSAIFTTILSIVQERLPPVFKFLYPYTSSLQSPPRHAILSAAVSNPTFLTALNNYVLKVAKLRHHSATLLGFWASITAQAVNGALETSRSGRENIRQQREDDLLTRLLPILRTALSVKDIPELYLGSLMIMTILVTKSSLKDQTLDAMMEAVAAAWTDQTFPDGLACLSVMAEEREEIGIPATVAQSVVNDARVMFKLAELSKINRVESLVASLTMCELDQIQDESIKEPSQKIQDLLDLKILSDANLILVRNKAIAVHERLKSNSPGLEGHNVCAELINKIALQSENVSLFQQAIPGTHEDLPDDQMNPIRLISGSVNAEGEVTRSKENSWKLSDNDQFQNSLQKLPDLADKSLSFLKENDSVVFSHYYSAFESSCTSTARLSQFVQLKGLKRSRWRDNPEFLTFLARTWVSSPFSRIRAKGLELANECLHSVQDNPNIDMQALLPYIITSLADSNQAVRHAGATLCTRVVDLYGTERNSITPIWMADTIYAPDKITWLPSQDASKFITNSMISVLEDCILDDRVISHTLSDYLSGKPPNQPLKHNILSTLCLSLATQARASPCTRVRILLLQIIGGLGKVASEARVKVLVPMAAEWSESTASPASDVRDKADIDLNDMDTAIIQCISHRHSDEIRFLQNLAAGDFPARPELCVLAADRLKVLLPRMSSPLRLQTVEILIDTALSSDKAGTSTSISSGALEALRSVTLSSDALIRLIELAPKFGDTQDQPPAKKRRFSRTEHTQPRLFDHNNAEFALRKITLVLELIEASKPEQHSELIKGLFALLSDLHQYKIKLGSELIYIHVLLLSSLQAAIEGVKLDTRTEIDSSIVRTDLIVDSIRTTSSSQVYNIGLLLISALASWKPHLVLHSVMPLFTFMSSTLLRQNDGYSAHVADQTIASIVPPLSASLKESGRDIVTGTTDLLLSFTAAFEHIPLHRRGDLFQRLVRILGPEDTLFALVSMLIDKYSDSNEKVLEFIVDLINSFTPSTTLITAQKGLDLVSDAFKPKRGLSNLLLGLDEKPEEVDHSVELLITGYAKILNNQQLRKQLERALLAPSDTAQSIRTSYAALLEKSMQLNGNLIETENLEPAAELLMLSVLDLMPIQDFIESSAQLMQTGSEATRQQVFKSLESRAGQAKRGDTFSQQVFIDVLPNCCVFIQAMQPPGTRHAAISCIDSICEKYGKKDRTATLMVAEHVAGDCALGSEEETLRIISILCLASMVENLGEEAISILPNVLNRVLTHLASSNASIELQNASFGFLGTVLGSVPWILSGVYLDRSLLLAARLAPLQNTRDVNSSSEFGSLAAKKVGAAEIFASIEKTWDEGCAFDGHEWYLNTLHQVIQHHAKSTIAKNASTLFAIILRAFDLRQKMGAELNTNLQLFHLVNRIALDMTLKLNDTTFRPFFIRLVEWTTEINSENLRFYRQLSFYHFALSLSEQLKSIVTSYASFFIHNASSILGSLSEVELVSQQKDLLDVVLQALASNFRNDQDEFWQAPAHFDAIHDQILALLRQAKSLPCEEHLIPTITELAAAASSPEHLKRINGSIMSYMRHADAATRLAAVKCERSITERLNFDWLALLPEMLPYISELQEDDNETVESETLRWVKQIENVTGESLEGMLV